MTDAPRKVDPRDKAIARLTRATWIERAAIVCGPMLAAIGVGWIVRDGDIARGVFDIVFGVILFGVGLAALRPPGRLSEASGLVEDGATPKSPPTRAPS